MKVECRIMSEPHQIYLDENRHIVITTLEEKSQQVVLYDKPAQS